MQIEHAWYEKVSRRKDFDLALINVAVKIAKCNPENIEATLCFGGTLLRRFSITQKFDRSESLGTSHEFTKRTLEKVAENVCPDQVKLNPSIDSFINTSVSG